MRASTTTEASGQVAGTGSPPADWKKRRRAWDIGPGNLEIRYHRPGSAGRSVDVRRIPLTTGASRCEEPQDRQTDGQPNRAESPEACIGGLEQGPRRLVMSANWANAGNRFGTLRLIQNSVPHDIAAGQSLDGAAGGEL